MKRMKQMLLVAALVCLAMTQVQAQDNSNNNNNGNDNGGRRRFRGGNFDPAQMENQVVENARDALEIKDDSEWKAIEPLIRKVVEAGMEARRDNFNAMRLVFRNRDNGGDNGGGGQRRGGFGGGPSAEMEALDKAVEAKASKAELSAAIAKVQEARKARQAALEKAQADLRKVLTARQEAIATSNGLL